MVIGSDEMNHARPDLTVASFIWPIAEKNQATLYTSAIQFAIYQIKSEVC